MLPKFHGYKYYYFAITHCIEDKNKHATLKDRIQISFGDAYHYTTMTHGKMMIQKAWIS